MRRLIWTLTLLAAAACASQDQPAMDARSEPGSPDVTLGPADGFDLPPVDLERVEEGDVAPDFTLASLEGPTVTLSDYRDDANVVLVFYRGHW